MKAIGRALGNGNVFMCLKLNLSTDMPSFHLNTGPYIDYLNIRKHLLMDNKHTWVVNRPNSNTTVI